jgi:hypothetical protein
VGDEKVIKPALRLLTYYRLAIEEIKDSQAITSYTRWVDAVHAKGAENQEVYLTFSPRFERISLEAKRRLVDYVAQKPADITLRSQYALRLYSWAKKYVTVGAKRIALEQLRKVLGLESVKDAAGNIIREAPLPVGSGANFKKGRRADPGALGERESLACQIGPKLKLCTRSVPST